jgi:hypothetical protein
MNVSTSLLPPFLRIQFLVGFLTGSGFSSRDSDYIQNSGFVTGKWFGADYRAMMAGYTQFFGTKDQPNKPARNTVQVILPAGTAGGLTEIERPDIAAFVAFEGIGYIVKISNMYEKPIDHRFTSGRSIL